jgi:hypothetical protein
MSTAILPSFSFPSSQLLSSNSMTTEEDTRKFDCAPQSLPTRTYYSCNSATLPSHRKKSLPLPVERKAPQREKPKPKPKNRCLI